MIDRGGMLPERAPVDHPLDPRNRPIPPCLALESRRSTAGEVMLLGRLVQRRRESPEEAWFDSYAAAWREAGRPELATVFTPDAWVLWPELKLPESLRRAALGTPSQLLLQPDLCTKKGCSDLTSALS